MVRRNQKAQKGAVSVLSQKGLLRLRWRLEGAQKRTLAAVRRSLWASRLFDMSLQSQAVRKVPAEFLELWSDLLCYAA
jgi:hypothetical protein